MGNYREQYEKYYRNIKRQGAASYTRASSYEGNNIPMNNLNGQIKNKSILEKMARKFIWQLSGSFILLLLVIGLRYVSMGGQENEFIEKTKGMIDEEFDVNKAVMYLNVPGYGDDYKEKALDYIDEIKSKISGERTLKEVIKEDYTEPVIGKIKYINGNTKGIAISTDSEENLDVASAYDGTVEEIRNDDNNKCIVINHGNGTETYYSSLSEVDVEEGDNIEKGQNIGKCGSIDTTGKKGVIFKFIYFGNEENPSDVMDLSSLEEV